MLKLVAARPVGVPGVSALRFPPVPRALATGEGGSGSGFVAITTRGAASGIKSSDSSSSRRSRASCGWVRSFKEFQAQR